MPAAGYGWAYRRRRAALLANHPPCGCRGCQRCTHPHSGCDRTADTVDHVPPLSTAPSPELWEGELVPACHQCNSSAGGRLGTHNRYARLPPEPTRNW